MAAAKIYGIDPGRGGRRADHDPRKAQVRGKAELINEMNLQGGAFLDNEGLQPPGIGGGWRGEARGHLKHWGEIRREIVITLILGGKQRWGEGAAD